MSTLLRLSISALTLHLAVTLSGPVHNLSLSPAAARADSLADDPALVKKAKDYYSRGKRLVSKKKYMEALALFSAGYELSKRPMFLFNMAECARFAQQPKRAIQLYRDYLAADPKGEMTQLATERITALGGQVDPSPGPQTPAPSLKTIDGSPRNTLPGATTTTATTAQPLPPTQTTQTSRAWYKSRTLWISVGVAVAAGSTLAFLSSRGGASCGPPNCIDLR